jgi:flagellar biosynthesis regulator FlaF
LPESLRAAIIKIYAYVQSETLRLQRNHTEGGVEALLEINGNVCAGLRGKSAATGATCPVS